MPGTPDSLSLIEAAGVRTHMLIALGAAATTIAGLQLYADVLSTHPESRADPLRVIQGVMAAIGFLGAGTIIGGRESVRNMTTAANVWLCGAIGLACGSGDLALAGIVFGFTIVVLTGLYLLERALDRRLGE